MTDSWYGFGPILGTPSEWGYYAWPDWAFVPVEEIYAQIDQAVGIVIPSTGVCCSAHVGFAIPDRPPVEPPYRAFCHRCVEIGRYHHRRRRSHPRRDRGLCMTCGEPAKLNGNAYLGMATAVARLELVGGTLAPFCSTRFCRICDPAGPRCRSRICAEQGRGRHPALPWGCCSRTKLSPDLVHCRDACARRREQVAAASRAFRARSSDRSECMTQECPSPAKREGSPGRSECMTQECPSPCGSRACRQAGRGDHPGNADCCAQARKSPHCAVECARARVLRDAGNLRRERGSSGSAGAPALAALAGGSRFHG